MENNAPFFQEQKQKRLRQESCRCSGRVSSEPNTDRQSATHPKLHMAQIEGF